RVGEWRPAKLRAARESTVRRGRWLERLDLRRRRHGRRVGRRPRRRRRGGWCEQRDAGPRARAERWPRLGPPLDPRSDPVVTRLALVTAAALIGLGCGDEAPTPYDTLRVVVDTDATI